MITTAAVLEAVNEPLVLHELNMLNCQPGQVHVRMLMAGVCGSQLQEIRGEKSAEHIPHLIGHEGCGVVEAVGYGVNKLKPGQRVVLHWRTGSGCCAGGTHYYAMDGEDHRRVGAGPVHTFATRAVVSENRCTAVPDDVPPELCCLLGCALSTALGVLENDAKLRMGESVLVVGCGGVGLSLISAAKMLGAFVTATDKSSDKGSDALKCGADAIYFPTQDHKCRHDCVIDTTGSADAILQTIPLLAPGGRYILVGQPAPGEYLRIPNARQLFEGAGATIIASQGGGFVPQRDIPRYVRLWRAGLLQWEPIVTHRYPLSEVNAALDMLRTGTAGRILLECEGDPAINYNHPFCAV